jgi:energy-converting hydrogenase Eha subunit G
MKIQFIFAWYDLWVGAFWDKKKRWLYILLIPMCGIILKFGQKKGQNEKT